MRVKLFRDVGIEDLEQTINDFIEFKIPTHLKVVDIKYAVSEDEDNIHYTAMIIVE